jgi:hypothetical protein
VSHTYVQLDVPAGSTAADTAAGTASGTISGGGDGSGVLPADGSRRRPPAAPDAGAASGGGVTISARIVAATAAAATAAMLASGVAGALLWRHVHQSRLPRQPRRSSDGDRQRLLGRGGGGGGSGGGDPDAEIGLTLMGPPSTGSPAAAACADGSPWQQPLQQQQQQQQHGRQQQQQQQQEGQRRQQQHQQQGRQDSAGLSAAAEHGYADGDCAIESLRSQGWSKGDRTAALLARTLTEAGGKVGEIELHPMADLPAEIEHQVEAAAAGLSGAATPAQLASGSLASCSAALAELAARQAALSGAAAAAERAVDPQLPPGFQRYAPDASGSTAGWSAGSPAGSGLLGGGGAHSGSTVLPPSPGTSGALGTLGPPAADPYPSKPRGQQRSWGLDPLALQLSPKSLEVRPLSQLSVCLAGWLAGCLCACSLAPCLPAACQPASSVIPAVHSPLFGTDLIQWGGTGTDTAAATASQPNPPFLSPLPRRPRLQFEKDGQGQLVVLGEGGFAVVYRARLGGRPVAVKVRRRGQGQPGF